MSAGKPAAERQHTNAAPPTTHGLVALGARRSFVRLSVVVVVSPLVRSLDGAATARWHFGRSAAEAMAATGRRRSEKGRLRCLPASLAKPTDVARENPSLLPPLFCRRLRRRCRRRRRRRSDRNIFSNSSSRDSVVLCDTSSPSRRPSHRPLGHLLPPRRGHRLKRKRDAAATTSVRRELPIKSRVSEHANRSSHRRPRYRSTMHGNRSGSPMLLRSRGF